MFRHCVSELWNSDNQYVSSWNKTTAADIPVFANIYRAYANYCLADTWHFAALWLFKSSTANQFIKTVFSNST